MQAQTPTEAERTDQDAPAIHVAYHNGEHYNSVRMAGDTGSGPPQPIALQERPASAKDWSSFGPAETELVMQGTGCYNDREAVQRALQDAKGNPDEVCTLQSQLMRNKCSKVAPAQAVALIAAS